MDLYIVEKWIEDEPKEYDMDIYIVQANSAKEAIEKVEGHRDTPRIQWKAHKAEFRNDVIYVASKYVCFKVGEE